MWLIEQMMYVSGETAEPSVETTGIIEDIVRQQVIELVSILSIERKKNPALHSLFPPYSFATAPSSLLDEVLDRSASTI